MEEEKDTSLTELTPYQLRFIDEYMKCGNKREAMMKSGYKGKGKCSTVTSSAAKLYNLPKVKEEIERRRRELVEKNLLNAGEPLDGWKGAQGRIPSQPVNFAYKFRN